MGNVLNLIRVSRADMGSYLCIASNGIPPSVSKRIVLDVECKYDKNDLLNKINQNLCILIQKIELFITKFKLCKIVLVFLLTF